MLGRQSRSHGLACDALGVGPECPNKFLKLPQQTPQVQRCIRSARLRPATASEPQGPSSGVPGTPDDPSDPQETAQTRTRTIQSGQKASRSLVINVSAVSLLQIRFAVDIIDSVTPVYVYIYIYSNVQIHSILK